MPCSHLAKWVRCHEQKQQQKHVRQRECTEMLARELQNSALLGRVVRNGDIRDLPLSIIKEQNRVSKNVLQHIESLDKAFQAYSTAYKHSGNEISEITAFMAIKEELTSVTRLLGNGESGGDDVTEKQFAQMFYAARGYESAMNFLYQEYFPSDLAKKSTRDDLGEDEGNLDWESRFASIACGTMNVLKDLCFAVGDFGQTLGQRDDLISHLLHGLDHKFDIVAEMSALFCEDVLLGRRDSVFDLRKCGRDFPRLVESWNVSQMLLFCRLVSLLTTDPDERNANATGVQFKSFDLLQMRRRIHLAELAGKEDIVAINQLFLLTECPEFIPRLVQLLEEQPTEARLKALWTGTASNWRRTALPANTAIAAAVQVNPAPAEGNQQSTVGNSNGIYFLSRVLLHLFNVVRLKFINSLTTARQQEQEVEPVTPSAEDFEDNEEEEDEEEDDDDLTMTELELEIYEQRFGFWGDAQQRDLWLLGQRLEVAHVLCTFCVGAHKKLVQDRLKQLNLITALIDRFDLLVWDPNFKSELLAHHYRMHGENCECNPQQTLKSQLLRLVHNFCDRESDNKTNKLQLFSVEERESMQQWNPETSLTATPPARYWDKIELSYRPRLAEGSDLATMRADAEDRAKFVGLPQGPHVDRGLAWRISAALLLGDDESSLRFWECAALEALLRGSSSTCKLMVCSWGVLEFICNLILSPADKSDGQLQTSFDLLAELIKDNPLGLAWLCGGGGGTHMFWSREPFDCFDQLCDVATRNLVDGNVFLRSVVLTARRSVALPALQRAVEWSRFPKLAPVLARLFVIVQVEQVSQENVCCLNTAVVLCTFARREGQLREIVKEAKLIAGESDADVNFRKLMWFWRCYYSCREVDRSSLEHSSGIKFEELEETVRVLGEPGVLLDEGVVAKVAYLGSSLPVSCNQRVQAWAEL